MLMTRIVAFACVAILVAERPAEACSCAPPPPPCQVYSYAGAVFVGRVTSVGTAPGHAIAATFAIEESFKAPFLTKTIVVQGGGMCGASFEAGKKYFVYASDSGGHWYASLCGRTRELADAKEDLAYARNIPNRKLAEVLGSVNLQDEQGRFTPRVGATVIAKGTSYSTKTDRKGDFKFQAPPGKYTLDVVDPGIHVLWGRLPELDIKDASACASATITVRYNGRIRGTLLDHTGKPAANVPISAQGTATSGALRAVSNAKGEYEIEGVQTGSYLVAVNHFDEGGPDAGSPIPTTFYPGVATEAAAKPVAMTRSAIVAKIDFKLPKPLAVYTVTGILKQKGQPMPAVHVNFRTELGPKYGRSTGGNTDANGRFTFKDVEGAKVSLEVCRPDAGPKNYKTACRVVPQTLTKDWTVDLEYPAP